MLSFKLAASYFVVALGSMLLVIWLTIDWRSTAPVPANKPLALDTPVTDTGHVKLPDIDEVAPPSGSSLFQQQLAAFQQADRSTASALKSAIIQLTRSDDPFRNRVLAFIYLEKLIALDPPAAANWVEQADFNQQHRSSFLQSVLTSWVRYDPDAAIAYLGEIRNSQLRRYLASVLLQDPVFLASADPQRMGEMLGPQGQQIIQSMTERQTPPETAFREALQNPRRQRDGRLISAFVRWYQQDRDAALQQLELLDDDELKTQLVHIVIDTESHQDPMRALEMVKTWAPGNTDLEGGVLSVLLMQDPVRGLPLIEAYHARTGNARQFVTAIAGWASQDIAAAVSYTRGLPETLQASILEQTGYQLMQYDPHLALQMADSVGNTQTRVQLFSMLPALDPALAESRLQTTNNEQEAAVLLQGIAAQHAQHDLTDALDWLETYRELPGFDNALINVFLQSAHQDAAAAAERLASYPASPQLQPAYRAVAVKLGQRDVDAAENWLESITDAPSRRAATESLAMSLANRDQSKAIELVKSLTGAGSEHSRLTLAQYLFVMQPGNKQAIVDALSLSDAQQHTLTESPPAIHGMMQDTYMMMPGITSGVFSSSQVMVGPAGISAPDN